MQPNTPILVLTLQIPVLADTSADQVMEAIGQKVSEMLNEVKKKQAAPELDATAQSEQIAFNASVIRETEEAHSDDISADLLAALGYTPDA